MSTGEVLKSVPKGWTLRDVQRDILLKVEEKFDSADVFIIRLPVAGGKSLLSASLARYLNQKKKWKSRLIVPNNMLLDQYVESFPWLPILQKRTSYSCTLYENQSVRYNCEQHKAFTTAKDKKGTYCKGCPYVKALRKSRVLPYVALNYYTYLAYKLYGEGLIIDEGHLVSGMLKSLAAKKLWHHDYKFPAWVRTYNQLHRWATEALSRRPKDKKLLSLLKELQANKTRFLIEKGMSPYRGEDRECLKLIPVDVKNEPPLLWPSKVKKIFFLSGTINRKDIEDIGLGDRRICIIDAPSPIPIDRRPLYLDLQFSLSAGAKDRDLPALARYILEAARLNPTRGFIHAPYSLANKLKPYLAENPRFMFHDTFSKHNVFHKFLNSEDGIMVASGMYEGIDLAGDAARWQIVTKVPWANLMEPAMKYLAEADPEGYANEAARLVTQAYGRVCRGPEDFGATTIVDKSFARLIDGWPELFPEWLKDAIVTE